MDVLRSLGSNPLAQRLRSVGIAKLLMSDSVDSIQTIALVHFLEDLGVILRLLSLQPVFDLVMDRCQGSHGDHNREKRSVLFIHDF